MTGRPYLAKFERAGTNQVAVNVERNLDQETLQEAQEDGK